MFKIVKRMTFLGVILLFSCGSRSDSVSKTVTLNKPNYFPELVYNGGAYSITEATVALGEKLFFDNSLSRDSSVSCASCHKQQFGFSDGGIALSIGIDEKVGNRNTPTLSNLAWYPSFMHDGGVNHIEVFAVAPITNPVEMDLEITELMLRLNSDAIYLEAFNKAFNSDSITSDQLLVALAHYQSTLISADAKYDKFLRGETPFSEQELLGLELFNTSCSTCHVPPLFTDFTYVKNLQDLILEDKGRGRITLDEMDVGAFKVSSLRNIAVTYPYMHDGRLESLDAVLEHYTSLVAMDSIDSRFDSLKVYSDQERDALKAFLLTLTDNEFIGAEN